MKTTPKEFADAMKEIEITEGGDPEVAHGMADDLLCELLDELGYGEGVEIYTNLKKWYV